MRSKADNRKGKGGKFYLFLFGLGLLFGLAAYVRFSWMFEAELIGAGERDSQAALGIGFSQPVGAMDAESIRFSPDLDFSYRLSPDRRTLVVTPAAGFVPETKYTIELEGVRALGGAQLLARSRQLIFYTGEEPAAVRGAQAEIIPAELFGEIALAKDKYVPPESSLSPKEIVVPAHWTEGNYIDIGLDKQVLTLFESGAQVNQFLISSGKAGMGTPTGEFAVRSKEENHWSFQYKLWMPYSLNFSGPYYIHELPYWPDGYREGADHLGVKVSHGCVRLGIGPAKYVFDWAKVGTRIYIHP